MLNLPRLPSLKSLLLIVAGFFGIAFLIYGWSLHNPFVRWDDGMLIYENPAIRAINVSSLKWIFTHFDPELYIPLTFLTYQIDYLIGGMDSFQYHLTNLVLHTLNALFVAWLFFLILKQKRLALFCGLLFLVHPLHTEAVQWASARKDVLSTFFFLSAILIYVYWRVKSHPRPMLFALSLFLFLCGLLSKVMIVTLPVVLFLIDWVMGRTASRRMVIEKVPYVALSIVLGLVGVLGKQGVIASSSVWEKILMAAKSMMFYVYQFFWPARLSLLYPYSKDITITSPDFFVPVLCVLALIAFAAYEWKRRRLIAVGIVFFLITVLPTTINFARGNELDVYFASDRYAYVPSIGILMVIAGIVQWMTEEIKQRSAVRGQKIMRSALLALGIAILVGSSALAYRQSLVWADTRALFEHVIRLYPDSSHVAHNNLGNMYRLQGDIVRSIDEYTQAIAIRPQARTYANVGAAYRKQKKYAEAMDAYAKALALDDKSPYAHFGLGIVYAELRQFEKAEARYKRAIELDPRYEEVHVNLGALYAAVKRYEDAASEYRKALAINPYYPQAMYNLGVASEALGNIDEAVDAYRQTISFDPTMIPPRINLGLLLFNKKADRQGAIDQFRAILEINPQNAYALSALRQMGEQ